MREFLLRLILFSIVGVGVYLGTMFAISNSPPGVKDWIGRNTNAYPLVYVRRWAYPGGDAFLRFREVDEYSDIDVLFIGSSHSYRSFDPRIFGEYGLSTFNLGSRAQTPINSYYLLDRHIDHLAPKLVVLEVYYRVFGESGLESLLELSENVPSGFWQWKTGVAIKDIKALNALLVRSFELQKTSFDTLEATLPEHDMYIAGGYVETSEGYVGNWNVQPEAVNVRERQLEYLRRIIRMVRKRGSEIVLVAQPLPQETRESILNLREVRERISKIAIEESVDVLDFNTDTFLVEADFYFDYHHLNQQGVKIFNQRLIAELREMDLLRTSRSRQARGGPEP